jgi:hypothetical protein
MKRMGIAALLCIMGGTTAHPDEPDGDRCAALLTPTARVIYDTAMARPIPGASLKELLTTRVRALVLSGQVSLFDARPAAETAADCLREARPWPPD